MRSLYTFDTNDGTYPLCTIGASDCFNNITATIELTGALGDNQGLQVITPDAWSISDGLTTVNDQTPEFYLYTLEVGTDASGNIAQWNFMIARNNTQPLKELSSMRTLFGTGGGTVDDTRYCTRFDSGACSYVATTLLNNYPGTWTVTTVPLPTSIWLLGSGLMGLMGMARQKKAASLRANMDCTV